MLTLNILIVEDSPVMAIALKQLVIKLGHVVAGVSESYEEAVHALTIADVDMVITDIMLKGEKNGVDLGAYIQTHLQIPVIYQSSITDCSVIYNAMQTCPMAYLVKPVNKLDLSTALSGVEAA
jgi:two-component SAPR family response regulator